MSAEQLMEKVMKHCTLALVTLALLTACGGGSGDSAPTPDPTKTPVNRAPQAQISAAPGQQYLSEQLLKFDGSTSSDPDNDPLTYSWQLTNSQQQNIALNNANQSKVEFSLPGAGLYTLSLQVNDGKVSSQNATVAFEIKAAAQTNPPVANAGAARQVKVSQLVQLSAEQSTPGQDGFRSFQWQLKQKPTGSQTSIQRADSVKAWLTPDVAGLYQAEITVVNNAGQQASQLVDINASIASTDLPPQASISIPVHQIAPNFALNLSAEQSSDDSAGLQYRWQVSQSPAGSQYQLTGANTALARFSASTSGDYQLTFQLTDGSGQQTSQQQTIVVRDNNLPPVAHLIAPERASLGQVLALDASESMHPQALALQYQWQLLAKPKGSVVQLSDSTSSKTSLQPDVNGQYLLALRVSSGNQHTELRRLIDVANLPTLTISGVRQSAVNQQVTLQSQLTPSDASLRYQWSLLRSPTKQSLTDNNQPTLSWRPPVAGSYQLQLQVFGEQQLTQAARWDLTVSDNLPPEIVLAGPAEQSGQPGALFSFDASQSRDPEQGRLTFSWQLQTPQGSKAVLLQADTATPSFTADVSGDYKLILKVSDDAGNVSEASRLVRISEPAVTINGMVSGRLVTPDNQPVSADVTILVNGSPAKADSNGYFQKAIRQQAGQPVKLMVRQQRSAILSYTSPVQSKDNFEVQLGTQRLIPELPLSLLTIQGCALYQGPQRFNLRFTLNELPEGSLFSTDFTITVPVDLTQSGMTTVQLPAGAGYQVEVSDANLLLDHSFGSGQLATKQQYRQPYLPLGSIFSTFTFCHR